MALSKLAIKQFVAKNANVYPYSEIKCTRKGYYCKWVILKSRGRNVRLHAVPSACVDGDTLQVLLCSEAAVPLTSEQSDIEDCMSVWGRDISEHWHHMVLSLLCLKQKKSHKNLLRLCIQIRVNELIDERLHHQDQVFAHLILLQWTIAYNYLYDYLTKDYFELCMRSFQFVVVKCNEALSLVGITPITTSSDEEDDGNSEVVVVPVVSSSS